LAIEQKSKLSNPLVATLLAILCTVLWGSAYPSIKLGYELFAVEANDTAGKIAFAGVRFALAGGMVLLFRWVSQKFNQDKSMGKEPPQSLKSLSMLAWAQIGVLGLAQTTIHYYFFYVGVSYTTGAKSSIINTTAVFFSALLSHIFYSNDKLSLRKGLGIIIGFIAVILINFEPNLGFSFTLRGEGFIIIAAFLTSSSGLWSKRISKHINPVLLTGTQLTLGGLLLFLISVFMGGSFPIGGFNAYLLLGYMALLSAVAFSVWTSLLKHNRVSSITIFYFLIPVVGTFLSALILKEAVFQIQYFIAVPAAAMGIYLVNSTGKDPSKA